MLSVEEIKKRISNSGIHIVKIDIDGTSEYYRKYIINDEYELLDYEVDIEKEVKLYNYVKNSIPNILDEIVYSDDHLYLKKKSNKERFNISIYNKMSEEEKEKFVESIKDFFDKVHSLEIPSFINNDSLDNNSTICIGESKLFNIYISDNKFDGFSNLFLYIGDKDYDYLFVIDRSYNDISKRLFSKKILKNLRLKNKIQLLKDITDENSILNYPSSSIEKIKEELEIEQKKLYNLEKKENKIKK